MNLQDIFEGKVKSARLVKRGRVPGAKLSKAWEGKRVVVVELNVAKRLVDEATMFRNWAA